MRISPDPNAALAISAVPIGVDLKVRATVGRFWPIADARDLPKAVNPVAALCRKRNFARSLQETRIGSGIGA